jgi:hypothetical protein
MKELELKSKVLKDLISFMKGKEKDSWKEVLGEGGDVVPSEDGEEMDSEDSSEECDCGEEDCKTCGKPKGVAVIEETVIVGKPKK